MEVVNTDWEAKKRFEDSDLPSVRPLVQTTTWSNGENSRYAFGTTQLASIK